MFNLLLQTIIVKAAQIEAMAPEVNDKRKTNKNHKRSAIRNY